MTLKQYACWRIYSSQVTKLILTFFLAEVDRCPLDEACLLWHTIHWLQSSSRIPPRLSQHWDHKVALLPETIKPMTNNNFVLFQENLLKRHNWIVLIAVIRKINIDFVTFYTNFWGRAFIHNSRQQSNGRLILWQC